MIAIEIPQIEYLSLSASRRYSFELPCAEAFGGAAYGEKKGPAIALVGAAGAIGTGITVGGLVGGLMIAGGIASAIGSLTGNEFLSTVGMGLSLAGGIGGAFTDMAGNFYNPFTAEGGFGGSALGQGLKGAGDKLSSFWTDLTGGPTAGSTVTEGVLSEAGANAGANITEAAGNTLESTLTDGSLKYINGEPTVNAGLVDRVASTAGGVASKGTGMLGSLGEKLGVSGDGMGQILSSAIQGVASFNPDAAEAETDALAAKARNLEANTNATNIQAGLLQQRYNNMQAQPGAGISVNPNADPYAGSTAGQGQDMVTVVMNGKVVSMPAAEYNAMVQQQQGA